MKSGDGFIAGEEPPECAALLPGYVLLLKTDKGPAGRLPFPRPLALPHSMVYRIGRRVRLSRGRLESAQVGGRLYSAEFGEPRLDRDTRALMDGGELGDLPAGVERRSERFVFMSDHGLPAFCGAFSAVAARGLVAGGASSARTATKSARTVSGCWYGLSARKGWPVCGSVPSASCWRIFSASAFSMCISCDGLRPAGWRSVTVSIYSNRRIARERYGRGMRVASTLMPAPQFKVVE